jgi:predicted ATPase
MQLSLLDECRSRVERALAALGAGANRDARREMKLHAAQGASLMYTRSVTDPEVGAAWTKALEIAKRLDDLEYQLRALWGVWSFQMRSGQHRLALALVQRFCSLAPKRPNPNDRLIGERMMGESEYLVGNLHGARGQIEHMLSRYTSSNRWSQTIRFQAVDQGARARAILARVLWLQGFPDQAMRTAESGIDGARETNHAISFCYDLALSACPIALLMDDLGAADHYVGMLIDRSRRHALTLWQAWGRYYQGMLIIKRGDLITGSRLLRTGLDELGEAKFAVRFVTYLGEVAETLGRAGQIAAALGLVEEAIARLEDPEESWLITDLLRGRGELLLLQGMPGAAAKAEDHFRQALDGARRHGALS